jgi:hypothetical protein
MHGSQLFNGIHLPNKAVILQAIENNVAITVHTSFLQPHHSVQPTLDRLISLIQGANAPPKKPQAGPASAAASVPAEDTTQFIVGKNVHEDSFDELFNANFDEHVDRIQNSNNTNINGNLPMMNSDGVGAISEQTNNDPTVDDAARVGTGTQIRKRLQSAMRPYVNNAPAAKQVCEYVPCVINFTGLAMSFMGLSSNNGSNGASFTPNSRRNKHAAENHKHSASNVLLGSSDSIARLTMQTVWFSPTSARAVWRFTEQKLEKYHKLAVKASLQVHNC